MKIGFPKIRLSKKLALISLGMLALLGGTGAAALYVGKETILGAPKKSLSGGECTTVQTLVLKTPARRLWMRKYISLNDDAGGDERIKTALRVAGVLAKANSVDLVQVSVIDAKGPQKRAEMRGRAIGAEVVIALEPRYLPDMKEPFIARYFDGQANDEGRFYGERTDLSIEQVRTLMGEMKNDPDKKDCAELPKPEATGEEGDGKKPAAHGETVVSSHGDGGAKGGETEGHGEAKPGEHAPAEGGHGAPASEATAPAEKSFLGSVLSMVGLGGSEPAPAAEGEHGTASESHASSSEKAPAETEEQIEKPQHAVESKSETGHAQPEQASGDASGKHDAVKPEAESQHEVPAAEAHSTSAEATHAEEPANDHSASAEKLKRETSHQAADEPAHEVEGQSQTH